MSNPKTRRRKLFIHSKIQGKLALNAFCQWSLFLIAAGGLLFALQFFSKDPFRPFSEHWNEFLRHYALVILVLVSMTPVVIYQSIKLSNRIVGPLFRLRNEMTRLANGQEAKPIQVRRRDLGGDTIEAFNAMLQTLDQNSRDCLPDTSSGAIPSTPHSETPHSETPHSETPHSEQMELSVID